MTQSQTVVLPEEEKRPVAYLHYVGNLYSQEKFEFEAQKAGVSRAVPYVTLKGFEWGQKIYVATWDGQEKSADIFGYFRIDGFHVNLPSELFNEFLKTISVEKVDNTPVSVTRFCGSYTISSTAYTKESLKVLLKRLEEFLKSKNMKPYGFKYFLKGSFVKLPNHITLKPAKFYRGYVRIPDPLPESLPVNEPDAKTVVDITNYKLVTYVSKKQEGAKSNG